MKELAGRLAAVDPDAGAAVSVIAYFDRPAESRAGLLGRPVRTPQGRFRLQLALTMRQLTRNQ